MDPQDQATDTGSPNYEPADDGEIGANGKSTEKVP